MINTDNNLFNRLDYCIIHKKEIYGTMWMKREILISVVLLVISTNAAFAATYTVGHDIGYDYHTITGALAAAVSGDTILVSDGTYNASHPTYPETFPLEIKEGVSLRNLSYGT